MFKRVIFTQRIIAFNESFALLGKRSKHKPFACLWNESLAGRKKEDLISTFHAFFTSFRDVKHFILWLDNCTAQNKNWSLFSYLIFVINSNEVGAESITFRYFEPGHSFMSADSFHHQVEMSLKRQKKVYDFADFEMCVQRANSGRVNVKHMNLEDFYCWKDHSSLYKINHATPRPILLSMVEVIVTRGKYTISYKNDFEGTSHNLDFLKMKSLRHDGMICPPSVNVPRGITEERKNGMCNNILPLIPANRHSFWRSLPVNNNAVDLRVDYGD